MPVPVDNFFFTDISNRFFLFGNAALGKVMDK